MKINLNYTCHENHSKFDSFILTPVTDVTKEPKASVLLCSPAAKFMTELQKKL